MRAGEERLQRLWRIHRNQWKKGGKRLHRALDTVLDWCREALSPGGFAYLLSMAVFAVQAVFLDIFLVKYVNEWTLFTLFVEVPLLIHLAWYWRAESAHRAAPSQWVVYSWVHAAKVVVLYIRVMPRLPKTKLNDASFQAWFLVWDNLDAVFAPNVLYNVLLATPVFYSLLMYRESVSIFGRSTSRITVDFIMHFDMLWHVAIDMVDQADLFRLSRVAETLDPALVLKHQVTLINIQTIIAFLLFLSVSLQAEALPGVIVDHWTIPQQSEQSLARSRRKPMVSIPVRVQSMRPGSILRVPSPFRWDKGLQTSSSTRNASRGQTPTIQEVEEVSPAKSSISSRAVDEDLDEEVAEVIPAKSSISSRPVDEDLDEDVGEVPWELKPARPRGSVRPAFKVMFVPLAPPSGTLAAPPSSSSASAPRDSAAERPVPPFLSGFDASDTESEPGPTRHSISEFAPTRSAEGGSSASNAPSYAGFESRPSYPQSEVDSRAAGSRTRATSMSNHPTSSSFARPSRGVFKAATFDVAGHATAKRRQQQEQRRRKRLQEIIHLIQRQSIVIARKRSAMTSIFFVDIPFLLVRIWLGVLLGQKHLSGMAVKNIICIILNVMQYPLVRIASRRSFLDIQCRLAEYYAKFCSEGSGSATLTPQEVPPSAGSASAGTASEDATPFSSPLVASCGPKDSPFGPAAGTPSPSEPRMNLVAREALQKVKNDTTRSTSVCVHFWAFFVAFGCGLLIAKGEYAMVSFAKWAESLTAN